MYAFSDIKNERRKLVERIKKQTVVNRMNYEEVEHGENRRFA